MRKFILTTFAILCFSALFANAQPMLNIVDGNVIDIGIVNPNDGNQRYIILLRNDGDEVLTVSNVQMECPCLSASMPEKNIMPDETSEIFLVFNPSGLAGNIMSGIALTTNQPGRSRPIIQFKAEIETPLMLDTKKSFLSGRANELVRSSFTVRNTTQNDITIGTFEATPSDIMIDAPATLTVSAGAEVVIGYEVFLTEATSASTTISFLTTEPSQSMVEVNGIMRIR